MADPDDGSCENYEEASKCLEEKSILSSHTSKCAWDEETATCSFRDLGGDIYRVVIVAMIVAVIGTPFALASEALICNILAADTIKDIPHRSSMKGKSTVRSPSSAGGANSSTPEVARKSLLMLKRAESALGVSAEDDYRSLSKELELYRDSLSPREKRDFDCE